MYLNSWDILGEGQVLGRAPRIAIFWILVINLNPSDIRLEGQVLSGHRVAIFWILVCNLFYITYGCILKCYINFYLRMLLNNDIIEIVLN